MQWGRAVGVLVVTAGLVAACSSGNGGSAGPSTPSGTVRTGGSSSPSAASTSSTAAASVPVQVATGPNGRRVPLVAVSVGGGPPVKVVLDTGSAGLLLERSAIGADATSTGGHLTRTYVGFSLTANIANTTVRLLGGPRTYTTAALHVGAVTSALTDSQRAVGAAGILGIAAGDGDTGTPPLFSPLAQLPSPLSSGYLIDLATHTLDLGAPAGGTIRVPLTAASWHYPDGMRGYVKPVAAQWTVGSVHATLPTTFDTGGGDGFLPAARLPSSLRGATGLPTGTRVSATVAGHQVVDYTTGDSGAPRPGVTSSQHVANIGEAIFEHARVGVDLAHGYLVIDPS